MRPHLILPLAVTGTVLLLIMAVATSLQVLRTITDEETPVQVNISGHLLEGVDSTVCWDLEQPCRRWAVKPGLANTPPAFVEADFWEHNAYARIRTLVKFPYCSRVSGATANQLAYQYYAYAHPATWPPVKAIIPGGHPAGRLPLDQTTAFNLDTATVDIKGTVYDVSVSKSGLSCHILGGTSVQVEP